MGVRQAKAGEREADVKMDWEDCSRPLDLKAVKITDTFWGREQELVRTEVIPYQWEALNDRVPGAAPSYCMRNYRVAGRLMHEKRSKGKDFIPPSYTFRGFEALPEDPAHPDPDKFYGFVFQDSDFAKWIEAAAYTLSAHPDPELERTADEAIDIVCAAQADNGYLNTYYIINGMDRIFTNLKDHHELYCFGHLIEGAVAYYQATGKDKLLKAVERYADLVMTVFGPQEGQCGGYGGHEIAEMALARLYEATGKRKYLELGRFFLDRRGLKPYYFDQEERERASYENRACAIPKEEPRYQYYQAHLPVRKQTEAVGHAVRAVYLYSGMADVARLTRDEEMYQACRRLWDSIVKEKLYITGGIGATHIGEAFSFPYDLPNDSAYSETCAAIGLVFFARRMLELHADRRYSDVMERALYNTVLAGMSLDGKSFFYVNPLEVLPEACKKDERKRHVKSVRQKWFGCACCPPNIARLVSSLGAYLYTQSETALFTHLYAGSSVSFILGGQDFHMETESGFPWDGDVKVTLHARKKGCVTDGGTLAFRIPGWSGSAQVTVWRNGPMLSGWRVKKDQLIPLEKQVPSQEICGAKRKAESAANGTNEGMGNESGGERDTIESFLQDGYLYLTENWQDKDEIRLSFPMEVRCVRAHTKVREDIGKVAFLKGPLCYCMEEADNGSDLHLLKVDTERLSDIAVKRFYELGHEMCVLKVPGKRQKPSEEGADLYEEYQPAAQTDTIITFLPYYAWSNRGEGEMSVWVRT